MKERLRSAFRLMLCIVTSLVALCPAPSLALGADPLPAYPVGPSAGVALPQARVAEAAPALTIPTDAQASDTSSPSAMRALQATSAFTRSLALDGDNDYVQVLDHDALDLDGVSGFTIEAWVRRADAGRYEAIIGKNRQSSFWLGFSGPVITFYSGGSGTYQDGTTTVPADVWTHIAVVWSSGGSRTYYINGVSDYTGSAGTGPSANSSSLYIGSDAWSPTLDEFSGNIAEVRIWNVARTQNEIRRTMHVALEEPLPGLVANWHLVENTVDNIGAHNGTLVDGADLDGPPAPPQPAVVPVDENFNALPSTHLGPAAVYLPDSNRVLVMGGYLRSQVYGMDAGSGETTVLSPLPNLLGYASAVYVPEVDTAYFFGGRSMSVSYSKSILAIDPDAGYTRTLTATLPANAEKSAAVYHAGLGQAYVIGGGWYDGISSSYVALRSISRFDPHSETLHALNGASGLQLPAARYGHAAAYSSATDKIYVFGGMDSAGVPRDTMYKITVAPDGESGTVITMVAHLPAPAEGLSAVEDPHTKLIYLLGGSDQGRILVFDPLTEELWETPIEIEERTYAGAIFSSLNRHALLIGGRDAEGSSQDDVWRVPLGDGPAVPLGRWDFPSALAGELVTAIDGDEDRVLVGTASDGVWRYRENGAALHYTTTDLSSASGLVRDVVYDADNHWVWIATDDAGAQLFDGESSSRTPLALYDSADVGTDRILALDLKPAAAEIDGSAFLGTYFQGLKWQSTESGPWNWKTGFSGQDVTGIAHRATNDAWVASDGYLKRFEYNQVTGGATETNYGAPCLYAIHDLAFGPNDDWWVIAREGELTAGGACFIPAAATPGAGTPLHAQDPIGGRAAAIDIDADGRVWVAFEGDNLGQSGGLSVWETEQSSPEFLRTEDYNWDDAPIGGNIADTSGASPLWESGITAVGAADERVWAGSAYEGLITLAQRWQQLDESNQMDTKRVTGLWTVRGRLFLATATDLYILMPDGKTWENYEGLQAYAVLGDSHGRIWVGTDDGVRRYTGSGWDPLPGVEGTPPSGVINALTKDRDGRIWIGGENGLTLFDRERFVTTFTTDNSPLPANSVNALLVDRDNRLWVGTTAGLARWDNDDSAPFIYTTSDGLAGNGIHDLAQRGNGWIAASTDGGLSVFWEATDSFWTPTLPIDATNAPLTVDELGRLWAGSAVWTAGGWQGYYTTNSGLRSTTISDNAADGADRVWFSHAPGFGVSVRGAFLPPLADTVPVITGVSPRYGTSGEGIVITGSGFGDNPADVSVTIGGVEADVTTVRPGNIVVVLNDDNVSGQVSVSVDGRRTEWTDDIFCAVPQVRGLSPTGGNMGVMVDILGSNFDPDAQVYIGDTGPHPVATRRTPGRIELIIQPEDGNGHVRVENRCHNDPDPASDTSDVEFRHIRLDVANVTLNQGVESYGLVPHKATMAQHYLTHDGNLRDTDVLDLDEVALTFSEDGEDTVYEMAYDGGVEAWPSYALETRFFISNTVNVFLVPEVTGPDVALHSELKKRGLTVAENTQTETFRPELPITVLLVPIMSQVYFGSDLAELQRKVGIGMSEMEWRMPLTGRVRFVWSDMVVTVDEPVDIGSYWQLYVHGHGLDEARRLYNENHDPDALIAFGVVHDNAADTSGGVIGLGFWPDVSELINSLLLEALDLGCQATSLLVRLLTFGLLGFEDSCQLEIPLYIGWAWIYPDDLAADYSDSVASLIMHELGHVQGLVRGTAPNGYRGIDNFDADTDNYTHSMYDETDQNNCFIYNPRYNDLKTFYSSPGVGGPVVNPLTGQQLYPQLHVSTTHSTSGVTSPAFVERAKAMMSYACERKDYNTFYEPVDIRTIFATFGATSMMDFFSDLATAGPWTTTAAGQSDARASQGPTPIPRAGQRIYASGIVTRTTNTGRLAKVQVLGDAAPLSAEFDTGYWLVQRDAGGTELARTGIFPVFTVVASNGESQEHDQGFFAATLLAQDGVASIELRHDGTVLDTFSAGGAAPVVTVSSPTGGTYNSGSIPVAWTATDADGDDLEIVIDYSPDGGTSWTSVVLTSEDSGSVDVPVVQLAGSTDAVFKVTASDGMNSGSDTSASFTVADQPPRPYIGSPSEGDTFMEGNQIFLAGGAYDNQDGTVAGENLRWTSDRDGYLGTGENLGVFLSVGTHELTLEATNSADVAATAKVTLKVVGDYDYDGITDSAESAEGLNAITNTDGSGDTDGDGLPLRTERVLGTNPDEPDSDGDGRDDGQEVVDGTDPAQADAPPAPDALAVYPRGLTFEADMSRDTPLPQQFVQVASAQPVTWTLTADVNWLAATDVQGTTPGVTTILAKAFEMDEGTHHGVMTFTNDAIGSVVTVPVTATISNIAARFDTNRDTCLNVGDVQDVAGRIPSTHTDDSFHYRRDVDQDADIDADDAKLMAGRWETERGACGASYPADTATVRVNAPVSVTMGARFVVDVDIAGAVDLAGFEFDLAFDPDVLRVEDVTLGGLLGSTGRTAGALGPVINNAAGTVAFGGYSYGATAAAGGNGSLAQIRFRALAGGDSTLDLQNPLLADPAGDLTLASSQDGQVEVSGEARIYLPLLLKGS